MIVDNSVTGLILHFRTPARTLACLNSIFSQQVHRVVIVDNSQDDGQSVKAMSQELAQLHAHGMHIDILEPTENLGFAAGVNRGMVYIATHAAANVLLINSDAVLTADSLDRMRQVLSERSIVLPLVRESGAAATMSSRVYYQRWTALYLRHKLPGCIDYPSGCCILIHRDLLLANLFDDDFFFYGEDVMLGQALRQCGIHVTECMDASVVHEGSISSRNGSLFYEYHMVRAHWLLASKLAKNRLEQLVFVLLRALSLSLRMLLRVLRYRSLNPWVGYRMATTDVFCGRFQALTPPVACHDLLSVTRPR